METLIKDLRFAVRSFSKRPGFLVIAVATLALGIGATTAMFGCEFGAVAAPAISGTGTDRSPGGNKSAAGDYAEQHVGA